MYTHLVVCKIQNKGNVAVYDFYMDPTKVKMTLFGDKIKELYERIITESEQIINPSRPKPKPKIKKTITEQDLIESLKEVVQNIAVPKNIDGSEYQTAIEDKTPDVEKNSKAVDDSNTIIIDETSDTEVLEQANTEEIEDAVAKEQLEYRLKNDLKGIIETEPIRTPEAVTIKAETEAVTLPIKEEPSITKAPELLEVLDELNELKQIKEHESVVRESYKRIS